MSKIKEAQKGGKPEEIRPKIMKIRKDHEGKLEALLTDAQKSNGRKCWASRWTLTTERALRAGSPTRPDQTQEQSNGTRPKGRRRTRGMRLLLSACILLMFAGATAIASEPIPDKLVVLTFDDASKSHFTVARPLLKKYKFGATFFVTEGFDMTTNKRDYMTWDEIARLHKDGFEIGNHTRDHLGVTDKNVGDLAEQVRAINERCKEYGIPAPVSFAYPGNAITKNALPILKGLGIKFARRGGSPEFPYKEGRGFAFEPGLDHPLLIPSAGDARPGWTLEDFKRAVAPAKHGKIAVLQFHGVPDTAHNWVATSIEQFEGYLKYLADNKFQVIALRDLSRYVDERIVPTNPWGVIEDRQRQLATNRPAQKIPEEARRQMVNALGGAFQIFRDKVMEELKVSQDQKKKLLERLPTYVQGTMEHFQSLECLKPEERAKKDQAYRQKAQEKVAAFLKEILKEDQLKRLRQLELQQEGPFALLARPDLGKELKLTDEQNKQFMGVVQDMQKKIEPLIKEAQSGGNPQEIMPKVMKIRQQYEGKIEALLTDVQKKQWKEMLGKPLDLGD